MKLKSVKCASLVLMLCSLMGCKALKSSSVIQEVITDEEKTALSKLGPVQTNFSKLPMSGSSQKRPWNGYYWPVKEGSMNKPVLGELSPATKLKSAFPNSALLSPRMTEGQADARWWEGWCNGVAAAAIEVDEPKTAIIYKGIKFFPHDIKAYFAKIFFEDRKAMFLVGTRNNYKVAKVDSEGRPRERAVRDINPGAFHLMLGNLIGLKKKPFLIDASQDQPVFVFPAFAYRVTSKVELSDRQLIIKLRQQNPGAARFLLITVVVSLADSHRVLVEQKNPAVRKTVEKTYEYVLELDSSGHIVGGEWAKDSSHPDFAYFFTSEFDWTRAAGGHELKEILDNGAHLPYDPSSHLNHRDAQ